MLSVVVPGLTGMQPIPDPPPPVPFLVEHLRAAYRDALLERRQAEGRALRRPDDPEPWGARALEAFETVVEHLDPGVASLAASTTELLATPLSPFAGMYEATPGVAEMYQAHSRGLRDAEDSLRSTLTALLDDALRRHFEVTDLDGVTYPVLVDWDELERLVGPLPVDEVCGSV